MRTLVNLHIHAKIGFVLLFGLLFYFVFHPIPAYAQQTSVTPLDLTVRPSLLELNAAPGETITQKIQIRNNSSAAQSFKIQVSKLAPSDDLTQIIPADPKADDEYINWLKFENQTFNAAAQEWTDIPLTINVPLSAAYGYYYAVRFTPTALDPNNQTTAKVQGEVVVPILLKVKKDGAKVEAQIVDFKSDKGIYEYLPTEFTALIKNTGNVHLKPGGNIFISGQGNKDLAILEFNDKLGNILPSSEREFKTSWNDGFITYEPKMAGEQEVTDTNGQVQKELVIHWDKLTHMRFGPYQARLYMVYDDGTRDVAIDKTVNFWVIPYTVIAIILVVVVVAVLLIRLMLRSYVKSQLKKHQR